jgi:hypothetical protein
MSNSPYQRITFRGHTLNRRTVAMLQQAEDVLLGFKLDVLQGSYNGGSGKVAASAGTHDGGGAGDVAWPSGSRSKALEVQWALRQVGFAVWVRDDLPGVWSHHIHAIAIGDKEMSAGAAKQVQDYFAGRNGLAGHARDSSKRPTPIPVFSYPLGVCHLDAAIAQARTKHPSPHPAVRLIQGALNAKTGTHLVTDGVYGPKTRSALARYEKQVGGDGDGIPGQYALARLGLARFRVTA